MDFPLKYEDQHLPVYIVDVSFDDDQVAHNHHCQDVSWVPAEMDTHYQKMCNIAVIWITLCSLFKI